MANIQKTSAIVLGTKPFKESSLFCSLFTKRFGKIKILAKGVRRPKSRICGTLEPFSLDEIIFYKRESKETYNLSDAVVIDNFEKIRTQPQKVNAALVLCEFFDKTLPSEEPDVQGFYLLLNFLKKLHTIEDTSIKPLTLYYMLKVLSGAGVRPHLENCVRCHRSIKPHNTKIDFSIRAGGLVCDEHFDDTVTFLNERTVDVMRRVYSDKNIPIDSNSFEGIEKFIADYLCYHLNNLVLNSFKYLK